MHGPQVAMVTAMQVSARNAELNRYARWEYGAGDGSWILAAAERGKPEPRRPRPLRRRLRYWLQSFRGFAAYDVRAVEDSTRV